MSSCAGALSCSDTGSPNDPGQVVWPFRASVNPNGKRSEKERGLRDERDPSLTTFKRMVLGTDNGLERLLLLGHQYNLL